MSSDNVLSRFAASLEGIPKMIAAALTKRSGSIKTRVEMEIDKIIGDFNIEKVVREVGEALIHNALTEAIEDHIKSKSGQQSIKDHMDKVLNQVAETPEVPPIPAPVTEESKTSPLFSNPLNLLDLQLIKPNLFILNEITPLGLTQALETFENSHDHINVADIALAVNKKDLTVLQSDTFKSFFDPITDEVRVAAGLVGSIYGIEVYSDACLNEAEQFMTLSGLFAKPVEIQHTTADKTMADIPTA